MAKRPITVINYKNKYLDKPISKQSVKPAMIISMGYSGKNVNDKSPLIYVLEVRKDRIYGLNLRYKPSAFREITVLKESKINQLVESKINEFKQKHSIADDKINLHKQRIRQLILSEVNKLFLEMFSHSLKASQTKYLLRNYLLSGVQGPKALVYKTT